MSGTPEEIALVREFVNTVDREAETDEFATPAALRTWMVERRLLNDGERVTVNDVRLATALRDSLRAQIADHHEGGPAVPVPDEVTGALRLVVAFDETGAAALVPADGGVRGGLARIMAAVHTATLRGSWERLKICPADDCQWAFYDPSKNRSKRWCSMSACGNRTKTRAYRARRRD